MEVETDLNSITDEDQLRKMWLDAEDFNRKKEIRTHLYKLREARLRGFYDDVDTTSASKTTSTTITSRSKVRDQTDGDLSREPVNLSNITKNKFPFKSHGDSIIDHTYQSYKTKEIRDSESPTHETNSNSNCNSNYKSQNQQHVADNNMPSSLPPPTTMSTSDKSGWNIQTSSEISPDGKTHKNELYATTEGYKQLDDGHSEFSGVNTEKSTVAIESENDKTIKRAENESKIKLHEKKVTGDLDNQRTETETTEVFSTSSKTFTSTNKPSFNDNIENICSNVNVKSHNIEENVEKVESTQETSQMKKSREILKLDKSSPEYQKYVDYLANQNGQILSETSEYIKPNVKLVTTKKQLEDGTVVTTRRYETEEYETGKIDTRSSTKVETDKDIKKTYKVDNKNIKQPVKQQEDKNFIYEKNVDSAHNAFASSLRNQSQTPSPTASRRSSTRSNLSQSPPSRSSFRRRPSDDENSTFSRKNSTRSSFSTDKKDETSEIRKSSITKRITSKTDETSTDGAVYSRSNSAKLRKMSKDDVKDKDVYRRKDSHPKSPIQKRYFGDDKERRNSGTRSTITTKKESETKEVTSRYVRKPSSDSIRRSPSPELKRKPSTSSPETSRKPSSNICRSPSPDMNKKSRPLANGSIKTVRNIDESRTTITNIRRSPSPELIRKSSPSPDKKYSTVETKTTTKINKNPRDFPEGPEKYPRKYSEDKEETCIEINSGYPKTRPVTEPVEFRPSPGRTKPSDFRRSSNTSTTVNIEESSTTEKTSKYIKSTDREEPKKPLKREPTPEISLKKLRKTSGPFSPDAEIEEFNYPTSKRTDTFIKEEQAREERDRRPVSPVIKRKPSELDSSTRRKSSSPDIPLTEAKKNLTERRDSLKKNQGDSRKSSVASTSPRRRSSGTIEVEDDKTKPSRKLKSVLKRSETYEERCRLILGMDNEEPTEKPDGSNISKENKDVPANNEFIIDWNTEKDDSLKKKKVPLTDRKDSAPIQVTPKRTTSSIHRSTSEHVISKLEKKKSQEIILESNRLPDVIQEPEEENNRKNMKGKAIEIPILNEETNEYMKSFHIEELDETDEIPDRIGNTPSPIISSPQYPPQEDNDGKYIDDDNCLSVNEKLSKFLSMEKQNQLNVPVPAKGYKPHKHNKKYWENDGEDEVVIIETTPFTPDKENISQVKKQFENIDVNRKVDDKAKVNSNISRGIVSSRKDIFEIANSPVESNILRERDNISDEGKSKVSQLRHSYMNHTISSMEHRRDSLELAKTSYGQKIRASEEPYEPKSSTAVKFELGPKTAPKFISNTRKESRELLIPQPVDVDVLDSRKLEDVSVRRSSVDIEEYIPTKFGVELKRKNSQPKQRKSSNPEIPHIEEIFDLDLLEEMLKSATGYEQRRRIRAQIRIAKKKIEDRKASGASPNRKMKSVTSTSTTTTKKVSSNDKGQDGFVRTSTVTTIKKQTGDKGEEKIVASTTTKRLTDQDVKTTTTKKRIEPTTTTKKTTTTTNDGPIWVRQNILRKVDSNERPVKTYKTTKTEVGPTKTVKTTTTTTTTSDGGQQKHTEVDVITSSYGIGPTDDDGKPLFGIRALKYKKSSEMATENTTNNNTNDRSNCKSFINESSNELTSINDVITRMQNADKVQEDGDTEKDREARALLNKFIGANILMSSIETTTGSVPPLGPNKGNKNQINCSTTTRTTKASTTISGDNKSSIPDDSKLLEDEEPLEVINFLKQIMAGREETDVTENTASQEDDTSLASSFASASAATSPIKELDHQDNNKSTASPTVEQKVEETNAESNAKDGESNTNTECAIVVDECASPEVDNKNTMSTADTKNRLKATNEKNSIEDSGTESSEDLRVLAADLREKIQMHSSKNSAEGQKDKDVISEVAEALTKLETSLKDGEDIHLNRGKRNALLTLVANLQNHLLCSEDGPLNSPLLETSSPEYDVKSNRHRFARKRNRANRHTVGVSKEELADARKYIEDLVLMESLSNVATPDASTATTPTSMKRNSIGDPIGDFDLQEEIKPPTLQLSKSTPKLNNETPQVQLRVNSQNQLGPKTRPLSDCFPEKNVTSAYQRALERSKLQRSPEPARARFSNKKQLMKRANTIDIPKTQQPIDDTDSEGEDHSMGLMRTVQVNVKQRPKNKVPEFVPKTENDHKFLAFLQKTSHTHGLGWNQNKSVTNWTNKFGNIKSAFETGTVAEKAALKPPMHPHHPSKLMSKSPSQLSDSKQIFSPPPQVYQSNHSVNPYHQKYSSQQDLQSHNQSVTIPKPIPINQFIHASKSVFKPVKPQISQFQPIKNDDTYNQPKWNAMSSASSPSGFSTHSEKWKNTSTSSSPIVGLPWTVKPTNTNSVLKIASSKFANPEPEEYKPRSNLNRGYSMKQLNTSYQPSQETLYNEQMFQKRPSLPDTLNPFGYNLYPQNSLTNPNHQPLILTSNNPIYCPDNNVKSPKSFDDPTPYPYTSPLPPQSPHSVKARNGPISYSPDGSSKRETYGSNKNYLSVDDAHYRNQLNYTSDDQDDGMEYKVEAKVMKSPISHQAVKIGSRLNQSNDRNSESARGLLDVMKRVSPKAQPVMSSQPQIDNVQRQREKFDQPDDYIYYEPQKQTEPRSKSSGFEKQRQMFDKPDDYEEYSNRKTYQAKSKPDDYMYYEQHDRPLPLDREAPFDRPLPYDRKVPDPDTQMKEEELRLLKERQAEIERQLFMKAEQERVEALEREKFAKAQQERQREIERELIKAKEEQLRKEEYERQMAMRAQQEEFERQRALRAHQEDLERQRALRAQQDEMERQRILRAQQEEMDRQRALRAQQDEIERQRILRAQQEDMERQRIIRAQQEEIERQKMVRAQEEHLKAQRAEIERQNLLKAQQYEMERQKALKAQEMERQIALKAEAERQKALKAEADRQKALKAESERQKALKAQQLSIERQKATKEKQKKSKLTESELKAQKYQDEHDEIEKQKFLKAQKEHQEFYQKERQKREEELQMIRTQKQNSIEEYSRRFSESELKVGQKRLVHLESHDLPDHTENNIVQNSIQVIEERRNSIQNQYKPDILPKPVGIAPKKPMIRSKTESAIDVEKIDWQQNPIYNGSDSKPNVIYNNVSMKTRAFVSQDSKDEDEEVVKSSLDNNMVFKKYGPPQRHCYLPNSYQSPISSSNANLSQSRPNLTKTVSNTTTNHVTKITAQFAAQQSLERHSPEPQLRRSKSGHTLSLPKMYEGKINKTELVQKQKTVEAYFTSNKSPNPIDNSQQQKATKTETTKKSTSSRRFKNKSSSSANGNLSRSHTMPQLNDLNLLDESNIEDAFDQLINGAKPSGEEVDSTKKDAVKRETTSSSSTTTTAKPASSAAAGKKPISPLNKFKQLEKQNSLQSPKSPVSPQVAGGTGTPPQSPIFKFTDPALNARALTFKEQLLQWCQAKTKEYENVQITNFSTSWNDGLAFCALIHHFLPESFDYSKLDNKHRRQNFELAFRVADEKAGIAPLLDVEDMVVMKKPDWKCVFTYVQSIFRRFRNCQ